MSFWTFPQRTMNPDTVKVSKAIADRSGRHGGKYRVAESMTAGKGEGLVKKTDTYSALQLTPDIIDMSL